MDNSKFDFNINNILNVLLEKRLEREKNNMIDEEYYNKLIELVNKNKFNNIDLLINENNEKEESFSKIVSAKSWTKLSKDNKLELIKNYAISKNFNDEKTKLLLDNYKNKKIKVKDIIFDKNNQTITNIINFD